MLNYITQLADAATILFDSMLKNLVPVLIMLGILWCIQIVNTFLGRRLNYLGIYPRHLIGLPGIVLSPLLHGDFNHLFFNSIPLFILMNFILVGGWHYFIVVTLSITLLSGCLIWIVGRRAIHIGASSLIMGYWSFLLINTYQHPSAFSILLAILTLYYLGSLVLHLFPQGPEISWEGHVCGAAAGIVTAITPWLFAGR